MRWLKKVETERLIGIGKRTLKLMRREDWTIELLKETNPDDEAFASTDYNYFDKKLTIRFNEQTLEKSIQFQNETMVHEIIHGLLGAHHKRVRDMLSDAAYNFEEEFVNSLTNAVHEAVRK